MKKLKKFIQKDTIGDITITDINKRIYVENGFAYLGDYEKILFKVQTNLKDGIYDRNFKENPFIKKSRTEKYNYLEFGNLKTNLQSILKKIFNENREKISIDLKFDDVRKEALEIFIEMFGDVEIFENEFNYLIKAGENKLLLIK